MPGEAKTPLAKLVATTVPTLQAQRPEGDPNLSCSHPDPELEVHPEEVGVDGTATAQPVTPARKISIGEKLGLKVSYY